MNSRKSDNNRNKLLYDPNQANLRRLGAFSSVQNYDENEIDDVRDEELENNDFEDLINQYKLAGINLKMQFKDSYKKEDFIEILSSNLKRKREVK